MNLSELEPPVRSALLAGTKRRRIERGGIVFLPGDPADSVYFVHRGRVKIVRSNAGGGEAIVGIRGEGDLFGELGEYADGIRGTSAVAIEALELDALPAAAFQTALEGDVAIARAFARGIARRLATAEHELAELLGKSVAGRLVDGLGRLAADHGVAQPDGSMRIAISLTHQDLADLIGTSRETVTKELGVLADVGLLRVSHKTVTLIQPRAFPFAARREPR
jgi:CRP/FNR family transcriptional regulator